MTQQLTQAQRRILTEGAQRGVKAYMQRRRACERLERLGLLERVGLALYRTTPAGHAAVLGEPMSREGTKP